MDKVSITFEIEKELKQKIEEITQELGVSIEEWCTFAIGQQLMMQESMEDLMEQVGQLGFDLNLEDMDFDLITNQLFSNIIDIDSESPVLPETPKILLPNFPKKIDLE